MIENCPNKDCPFYFISEKRNRDGMPVSRTEECLLERQHKPCEETEVEDKTDIVSLGC